MGAVKDKMLDSKVRPNVVADCVKIVDNEVSSKKGVTGLVIKGGYKAFKAFKPTIVEEAVDHLLDDFVAIVDKHYQEYLAEDPGRSTGFDAWVARREMRLADDMLGVTDSVIERTRYTALKKIYQGLRSVAQKNVAEAVPAIGRLVVKYVA